MSTKIKICGLSRMEDIEAANKLKPDYIGFVFWEKSKRNVSKETARELRRGLDSHIKTVGVFVDADIDFIYDLLSCGIINLAQLHGTEGEVYIKKLRDRIEEGGMTSAGRIIKAFNVNNLTSFDEVEMSPADYVMLDSGKGSGVTFDWSRLNGIERPYFLAGGLSPDNVGEVLQKIKPYAVDVSSGVETDGVKDAEKMTAFVTKCR